MLRLIKSFKGNIALVVRGNCAFLDKVLNAQKAGAKAVIIMNIPIFRVSHLSPGVPMLIRPIVIPAVLIGYEDGIKIRTVLSARTAVNVTLLPSYKDGDLDNGVIAHEYGHGISNRLTGGLPQHHACLMLNKWVRDGVIIFH
jgi:hypothetical protein